MGRVLRTLALNSVLFGLLGWNAALAEEKFLTDDFSRGDLLRYAMSIEPGEKAFPDRFQFPKDASDRSQWQFGTDVSHHDGLIDWTKARAQSILFAYVKVSQGIDYKDRTFARNWSDIGKLWGDEKLRVYRGAYHFLSAEGDAKKQAEHFLATLGPVTPSDLPATVDLEWDAPPGASDPGASDRWRGLSSAEIVAKVKTFLDAVEKGTGKTPIIYTAASWWSERIGKTDKLANYRIWIADYSRKSQLKETPRVPAGYNAPLWQFSERGRVREGFTTNVDVNIFKGDVEQFLAAAGVPKP